MTNPNDPAFIKDEGGTYLRTGLTKREEFAKAAMQGMLANSTYDVRLEHMNEAVEFADALIKELSK